MVMSPQCFRMIHILYALPYSTEILDLTYNPHSALVRDTQSMNVVVIMVSDAAFLNRSLTAFGLPP